MRKNSPRKWLHACLDLLPVILIPVFMIYSHRHTIDSGSIQVQEKQVVDFNQKVDVIDSVYWENLSSYSIYVNNGVTTYLHVSNSMTFENSHKYYYRVKSSTPAWRGVAEGLFPYLSTNTFYNGYSTILTGSSVGEIVIRNDSGNDEGYSTIDFNLIDLTQMYGEGKEPTASEFQDNFPDFYDYVLSYKQLVNGDLVTYNDTDIMSQFTYQLYNAVDKYFNMGNVFNMNGVYDWFNLNIFNGSAPIYIYVVWQIVLYEFVMDLLFLLYGLFMWFIDMVEHIMNKPFKSIK